MNWHDVWDSLLGSIYLLAVAILGYAGWGAIKIFKIITPHACKVVAKMVSSWIVDLLTPVIHDAISKEIAPHLQKIKDATHGKKETTEGALSSLLDSMQELKQQNKKIQEKLEVELDRH